MQIRQAIADFIASVGYRALLSELPSFPVDPSASTVENCKRRVEQDADMLVLVIGGRYGSAADKDAKSVTNVEYLTARAKGIPVFAFVEKRVLAHLLTWERNPQGDFLHVVDTPKLFEFIRQVRSEDSVWMHEFEKAADITDVLRIQWALLMADGLAWRRRIGGRGAELDALRGLQGEALRVAIEKPGSWEYKLFAHAVTDVVHAHGDLRREHKLGVVHPPGEDVGDNPLQWVSARLHEGMAIADNFGRLGNAALQEAVGPLGQPGSVAEVAFVAREFGHLYRSAIQWSQRISGAHIPDQDWKPLFREMARFMDSIIEQVETTGPMFLADIAAGEERVAKEGGPVTVHRVVAITVNADGFYRELAKLREKKGLPPDAE
jgi:uncharacterized protein DUF4062